MKKAVISNRIYLSITPELKESLLKKLTYRLPPRKPGDPYIIENDVTRINNNIITIPSGRQDLIPGDYTIIDKRTINNVIFPEFKHTLRDSQKVVYDAVNDSCMIRANPSWGKTFTALAIAAKLGQKTLIIVNTITLRDQWIKEVKNCFGINNCGVISRTEYNTDCCITIANVQSLKNRMDKVLSENFGTIIVDECHHIVARVFKTIVDRFKSRFKIGLTATPWRADGRHVMIPDYLGIITHDTKDENRLDPQVLIVDSEIEISCGLNTPWQTKLNELYNNPKYIELVINLADIQASRGHLVLVVADRIEFLELCHKTLEDKSVLIIGSTIDRNFLKHKKPICFATARIFAEGVNIPELSSLILGTPINNRTLLEQLLGRISRMHPDKKNPQVIDIALRGTTGKNQLISRVNYYSNAGLDIKYL